MSVRGLDCCEFVFVGMVVEFVADSPGFFEAPGPGSPAAILVNPSFHPQ